MGLSTNSAKANYIGHNEIVLGDFQKAIYAMEELPHISSQEVIDCARKYLRPSNRSVVIGLPEGEQNE